MSGPTELTGVRVVVTGGAGFIGSHLVHEFADSGQGFFVPPLVGNGGAEARGLMKELPRCGKVTGVHFQAPLSYSAWVSTCLTHTI